VPKPPSVGFAASAVAAVAIATAATDRGVNAAEAMTVALIISPRMTSLPTLSARTTAFWLASLTFDEYPWWTRLIALWPRTAQQ
jgi:hypothetical protein